MIKKKLQMKMRKAAMEKCAKKIDISFVDGVGMYNHACHLNAVTRKSRKQRRRG